MIGKKFVEAKKQEFEIKEFTKLQLKKSKISEVRVERTPLGEKLVIVTAKPGLVIGSGGENIQRLTDQLKKKFKLENPQIEVVEPENPAFDANLVADNIANTLERFGHLSFKLIAYRELDRLFKSGALGAEIRLSGKLPSERAKNWRFAFGYLKKTGETANIVKKAKISAFTRPGTIGIKVAIVPPNTKIPDKIEINKEAIEAKLKEKIALEEEIARKKEKETSAEQRKKEAKNGNH